MGIDAKFKPIESGKLPKHLSVHVHLRGGAVARDLGTCDKSIRIHEPMAMAHTHMVADQYSFILEWPFIAEKKISFADLSRPHREAWSYNHI